MGAWCGLLPEKRLALEGLKSRVRDHTILGLLPIQHRVWSAA